ncbi:hypothetical protein SUGI_0320410 [Cryptomeria japonica]|nr:hypothetical protein SUGI_0320410 [Cryptomeria japonica]
MPGSDRRKSLTRRHPRRTLQKCQHPPSDPEKSLDVEIPQPPDFKQPLSYDHEPAGGRQMPENWPFSRRRLNYFPGEASCRPGAAGHMTGATC